MKVQIYQRLSAFILYHLRLIFYCCTLPISEARYLAMLVRCAARQRTLR
ncbi:MULTISPECIES: hypothetical protein [unclassified Tolypothrix]|nr:MULTISPECIES: hypothetical protein [unclassified Tolypothrix]EKF01368.1 hypothetical protein FDUTEX481_08016 [Tolypothrix sp. PCC 7601]MBE9085654.1 hypothetical protein [Tolypothrix sp. LEGE 11397]UYD34287.1 hypothetical protein HG267_36475 [Tolypothrix sp. PCC 7601]